MKAQNPGRILQAGMCHLITSGTAQWIMDVMNSADNEGPCMGIELNIWELAKVGVRFFH